VAIERMRESTQHVLTEDKETTTIYIYSIQINKKKGK
jgi:hypothetical protein